MAEKWSRLACSLATIWNIWLVPCSVLALQSKSRVIRRQGKMWTWPWRSTVFPMVLGTVSGRLALHKQPLVGFDEPVSYDGE